MSLLIIPSVGRHSSSSYEKQKKLNAQTEVKMGKDYEVQRFSNAEQDVSEKIFSKVTFLSFN